MTGKIFIVVLMAFILISTAACHTVHGVGQDIEGAGKSIERATDK